MSKPCCSPVTDIDLHAKLAEKLPNISKNFSKQLQCEDSRHRSTEPCYEFQILPDLRNEYIMVNFHQ